MDITIYVAIAGVAVACASLGWHIYNTARDRPKVKVSYEKGFKFFSDKPARFIIIVTNVGRRPIAITKVGVKGEYFENEVSPSNGVYVLTENDPCFRHSIEEEKLDLNAIKYVWAEDIKGKIYGARFKNKEQK